MLTILRNNYSNGSARERLQINCHHPGKYTY